MDLNQVHPFVINFRNNMAVMPSYASVASEMDKEPSGMLGLGALDSSGSVSFITETGFVNSNFSFVHPSVNRYQAFPDGRSINPPLKRQRLASEGNRMLPYSSDKINTALSTNLVPSQQSVPFVPRSTFQYGNPRFPGMPYNPWPLSHYQFATQGISPSLQRKVPQPFYNCQTSFIPGSAFKNEHTLSNISFPLEVREASPINKGHLQSMNKPNQSNTKPKENNLVKYEPIISNNLRASCVSCIRDKVKCVPMNLVKDNATEIKANLTEVNLKEDNEKTLSKSDDEFPKDSEKQDQCNEPSYQIQQTHQQQPNESSTNNNISNVQDNEKDNEIENQSNKEISSSNDKPEATSSIESTSGDESKSMSNNSNNSSQCQRCFERNRCCVRIMEKKRGRRAKRSNISC